ncbi:nucleoside deaminase [Spiroplasma taiwanense]|nr:deaminase [Spiroplasma taiwanense]
MNIFFKQIIKELEKCKKSQDVPVSAVIVDKNNILVSKGYNTRQKKYNFCNHAEINAINSLFKKNKNKNLSDYKLIVTLKPCLMCITVIEQANIKKVYYYLENIKCDYSKYITSIIFLKINDEEQKKIIEKKLKSFFLNLRK